MGSNEFRPSDNDKRTNERFSMGENQTTGQYDAYGQYSDPAQQKQKKRGKGVLVALLMLLSLVVGGLLTAYVIMPAVVDKDNSSVALETAAEDKDNDMSEATDTSQTQDEQAPSETLPGQEPKTTDKPFIGGQAPSIDSANNPIVQIAQEVGPAVVGVAVSAEGMMPGQDLFERESGYGTGIILTEDGYIVTNNHVIDGSRSVKIALIDDTEYAATVVGADATTDIAVLKIDAQGLTAAAFGDSDDLLVGETVVAIGNPLGSELAGSVTSGIISAVGREISTNGFSQEYIQTDAAINPGNSGGALVDIEGKVIGINTLKSYLAGYDDYGVPIGTEGIGFAIPINSAKPIIEQLMKEGKVERPGIGISCLVDVTNAYNPEGSPDGVTVVSVVEGGPADKAGLSANDIITAIDDVEVKTVEELTKTIQSHAIGDEINVTVWRDGKEYGAEIVVGDLNNM